MNINRFILLALIFVVGLQLKSSSTREVDRREIERSQENKKIRQDYKILRKCGLPVDKPRRSDGATLLQRAVAESERGFLAKALLKKKADVNRPCTGPEGKTCPSGMRPLDFAMLFNPPLVKSLIAEKANAGKPAYQ
jgi:hypothetical protein